MQIEKKIVELKEKFNSFITLEIDKTTLSNYKMILSTLNNMEKLPKNTPDDFKNNQKELLKELDFIAKDIESHYAKLETIHKSHYKERMAQWK